MKIVNHITSTAAETSSKPAPVDSSKGSFQNVFADAIKNPGAASKELAASNSSKSVKVDAKKSDSADGKKKSDTPVISENSFLAALVPDVKIVVPVPVQTATVSTAVTGSDEDSRGVQGAASSLAGVVAGMIVSKDASVDADATQTAAILDQTKLPVLDTAAASPVNADVTGSVAAPTTQGVTPESAPKASIDASMLSSVPAPQTTPTATTSPTPVPSVNVTPDATSTASAKVSSATATAQSKDAVPSVDANAVPAPQTTNAAPSNVPVVSTVPQVEPVSNVSGANGFKASLGKSGAVGQVAGSSKSKQPSSDLRSGSQSGTDDDKDVAAPVDNSVSATRIAVSEIVSKDVPKSGADTTALAQSVQSAQVGGSAAPTTPSEPAAHSTSNAAVNTLPAQTNPVDNTQVQHAMSSAQLIQSAHGSEMRLGLQSAEFGNISINTSLNHQAISAQISIDHSALGHALSMHLPAIEEKLGTAYGLQAKVELRDTASNSSLNDSNGGESRSNRQAQSGGNGTSTSALQGSLGALTSSNLVSPVASSSRLDIRI